MRRVVYNSVFAGLLLFHVESYAGIDASKLPVLDGQVSDSVDISYSQNSLFVKSLNDSSIINWKEFSIGKNSSVHFPSIKKFESLNSYKRINDKFDCLSIINSMDQ